MTIRQGMLAVARRAADRLRERRGPLVRFVLGQLNHDGGFKDRRGTSDLYYTVFGIECLLAAGEDPPAEVIGAYLRSFGGGEGLDLVHLACLARCRAALGAGRCEVRGGLLDRIRSFRRPEGGYALTPLAGVPSVYAGFLALGALQDLGAAPADPDGLLAALAACRTPDGGYAAQPGVPVAMTPTTAAAVVTLAQLGAGPAPAAAGWLLGRRQESGGFLAADGAPEPDLLCTAVALHALAAAGEDLRNIAGPCRRFVEGLWCRGGGFRGHQADEPPDCEYTFYGLLALGHLGARGSPK